MYVMYAHSPYAQRGVGIDLTKNPKKGGEMGKLLKDRGDPKKGGFCRKGGGMLLVWIFFLAGVWQM